MTETVSFGPVANEIPLVAQRLRSLSAGHHPLLGEALAYVFETEGKRIRPALVLLSGHLGTFDVEKLVILASAIEVVHTATLVHDDTVDQALTRRGLKTVNSVWDGKVAILLGDFLFAQSAQLSTDLNSVPIMRLLSETVMSMSSGELQQYSSTRERIIDESDYLQRIAGKTASLFSMCCTGAALITGQSQSQVDALQSYGTNLGMAFQIADDVLDFTGSETALGKPAGSDFRQGTITLPIILLKEGREADDGLLRDIETGSDPERVIEAVRASRALRESLNRAHEYARTARDALDVFPGSPARDTLIEMTHQVIARSR